MLAKVVDGCIELTELMSMPGGEPRYCYRFTDLNYKPKAWELLYCQECVYKLWAFNQEESTHDS